jgi:hypothetical protein
MQEHVHKRKPQPVEHFLITVDLHPQPYRMHSYVMTNDRRCLEGIANKMFDIIEKEAGVRIWLPIILQTTLGTTVKSAKVVRDIVAKTSAEAKAALETATDFHLTIFMLRGNNPDDKTLMDLH